MKKVKITIILLIMTVLLSWGSAHADLETTYYAFKGEVGDSQDPSVSVGDTYYQVWEMVTDPDLAGQGQWWDMYLVNWSPAMQGGPDYSNGDLWDSYVERVEGDPDMDYWAMTDGITGYHVGVGDYVTDFTTWTEGTSVSMDMYTADWNTWVGSTGATLEYVGPSLEAATNAVGIPELPPYAIHMMITLLGGGVGFLRRKRG